MLTIMVFALLAVDGPTVYGKAPKNETPMVAIEDLMKDPESYLGKVVRVTGTVKEVCPLKGCWTDVAQGKHKVRIKVRDGEIVFGEELINQQVVAEGTVYKFDLTREQAVNYYQHLAEERGEDFDPASVTKGETIYQLGGIGLVVK